MSYSASMEKAHTTTNDIEAILTDLLASTGISHNGVSQQQLVGQTILSVNLGEDTHPLASHPDTVHALDYLVKKIIENQTFAEATPLDPKSVASGNTSENTGGRGMFIIDINGVRINQIKDLQSKALLMAEQARALAYDVELSPMSSYERLIIHTTLQGASHITTESLGEGANRRVVIKYVVE